jgi:hypothetical protein
MGEDELALLLVAPAAARQAARERIAALAQSSDPQRLAGVLERQRLLALAAARMREAGVEPPEEVAGRADTALRMARAAAVDAELSTLRAVAALGDAGIRALPLKGPILARELYGDPGLRPSIDVDILVAPDALDPGGATLAQLGYRLDGRTQWEDGRPLLHTRHVHERLPAIELHWRVHWFDSGFSQAMLAAAAADPGDGALRARPIDQLVALMLFHARDGLAGLRYAADIAAWLDRHGPPPRLAVHRRIAPSLGAAAASVERLTGIPAASLPGGGAVPARVARAVRLSDWRLRSSDNQVRANTALVDLLLAPTAADRLRSIRRHVVLPDAVTEVRRGPASPVRLRLFTAEHAARVGRRMAVAAWATRGGRDFSPLPAPRAGGRPPDVA